MKIPDSLVKQLPYLHVFGSVVRDIVKPLAPTLNDIMNACSIDDIDTIRRYHTEYPDLDFNQCDYDGRTPLHITIDNGSDELYRYLTDECGAIPDKEDKWGNSDVRQGASSIL